MHGENMSWDEEARFYLFPNQPHPFFFFFWLRILKNIKSILKSEFSRHRGLPLIPEMKLTGGEPHYYSGFDGIVTDNESIAFCIIPLSE